MDLTRLNTSSGIVAVPLPFTLSPSEDPAAATRSAVETGFSCAVETRATGALPWCNFVTEEVCMWKHDAGRTMPGEKRPKEMTLRVVKRMTVFQRRPSALGAILLYKVSTEVADEPFEGVRRWWPLPLTSKVRTRL